MVATSGDRLLDADAERSLRALLPLADVLTPNVAELAVLVGDAAAPTWTPRSTRDAAGRPHRRPGAGQGRSPAPGDTGPGRAAVATDALVDPDGAAHAAARPLGRDEEHPRHRLLAVLRARRAAAAAGQLGRPRRSTPRRGCPARWPASDQLEVGSGAGPGASLARTCGRRRPVLHARCGGEIAPDPRGDRDHAVHPGAGRRLLPWPNFRFYLAQDASTCGNTPAAWPGSPPWRRTRTRRSSSRTPPPARWRRS